MEVYILDNEQPTGCPKCGVRTEFTETFIDGMIVQHHHCPQPLCQYKFIGEFDKEGNAFDCYLMNLSLLW